MRCFEVSECRGCAVRGCVAVLWLFSLFALVGCGRIGIDFIDTASELHQADGGSVPPTGVEPPPFGNLEEESCFNGVVDGYETGVDCGGPDCVACDDAAKCSNSGECSGGLCVSGLCVPPTCDDGVQNQQESGVDCGGSGCPACPTCDDRVQNQDETGVDCGGAICGACASCSDGVQNQDETGIDCGGAICGACASCSDGIQNQDETGVDCGGASCLACPCAAWTAFGSPEPVTGFGLSGSLYGPTLSPDGGTIFFSQQTQGVDQIYSATRSGRGTVFSSAERSGVNSAYSDGTPFMSADGLTLYFFSARPGGFGGRDIMFAERTSLQSPFLAPDWLGGVNSAADDDLPNVTADGLAIVFTSTRSGGEGDADLWMAYRSRPNDKFSAPTNLTELNTSFRDASPSLSSDELTIYFISNRGGGRGSYDIWTASRQDVSSKFSSPQNLAVLNSAGLDLDPFLSADGTELFFASDRSGRFRIWRATRECL